MTSIAGTQQIMPFLWFDNRAEEAIRFYTSIFPNSEIVFLKKWEEGSGFPPGTIMQGVFVINGLTVHAFDAGPQFKFSEAVSFYVNCDTQEEIDHYWDSLTRDGQESQCGWLKDKFGFSWQIVPSMLAGLSKNGDPKKMGQLFQALLKMKKLDIEELEAAYNK